MVNINDILGKGSKDPEPEGEPIEVDGMCECFWPIESATYNKKDKILTMICVNGHVTESKMELLDG
jgi:hypothetical protein